MGSRMDKYSQSDDSSRMSKNQDVYEKIYETREYNFNDVEELASNKIDNARELTRKEYQDLIEGNREEKKRDQVDYNTIMETRENKIYNINDLIKNVKEQKNDMDEKVENLKNTQYNVFSSVDITKVDLEKTINDEREIIRANKEELNDMLQTISKGLSSDLIDVFDSNEPTTVTKVTQTEISVEKIENQEDENTFYDGTVAIHKKDIENDEDEKEKSGNGFLKFLWITFLIIILIIIGYLIATYIL